MSLSLKKRHAIKRLHMYVFAKSSKGTEAILAYLTKKNDQNSFVNKQ